jgi:hypothetical protein
MPSLSIGDAKSVFEGDTTPLKMTPKSNPI